MKKLLLLSVFTVFSAHAEIFMLPEESNILYENTYPLNEYLVADVHNRCMMHYLSENGISNGYVIRVENESFPGTCLEKGFADVALYDEKNNLISTWNGYFSDGFFVGSLPLNAKVIKRYSDAKGAQYLNFLIEEDKQLKIRYIGTMHSFVSDKGQYTAFDACHPFEIIVQTPNTALFENADTLKNITSVVINYAQTLCPRVKDVILSASDSPSLTADDVYFTQHLRLAAANTWSVETIKNEKPAQIVPKIQEKPSSVAVTNTIKTQAETLKTDDAEELDNIAEDLLDKAIASEEPVFGTFAIHVSKANRTVVFADRPFIMKSFGNQLKLKAGWYQVSATLEPMDDFEKKKSGISLKEKAAIIKIKDAVSCSRPLCQK